MNSQDWTNRESERSFVIDELISFCSVHGLNYSYTQTTFSIPLPTADPLPTATELAQRPSKKSKPDFDKLFPSTGIREDELPPADSLDEGTPPEPNSD